MIPTVVGLIVASALGYTLLSYALSLIAMLGLFFFMLFGLIIGAAMYRSADKSRIVPRPNAIVATVVVSLVCWSIAVTKEAVDYPQDFVRAAIENKKVRKPRGKVEEIQTELHGFINEYLKTEYPPGGVLGYFKMVATGGAVELTISSQINPVTIKPRVSPVVWWIRVLASVVLLYFSIWSQVSLLTKPPKAKHKSSDVNHDEDVSRDENEAGGNDTGGDELDG
ncbi:MAG: hypothetical protein DHS20C16_20480 [Phycisphaerae bacterium]|nr:MAG: hypothetical protein DHS20C16_20480 [Phycisphaerae bacterium]